MNFADMTINGFENDIFIMKEKNDSKKKLLKKGFNWVIIGKFKKRKNFFKSRKMLSLLIGN